MQMQVFNEGSPNIKESLPGKKKKKGAPFLLFANETTNASKDNLPVVISKQGIQKDQKENPALIEKGSFKKAYLNSVKTTQKEVKENGRQIGDQTKLKRSSPSPHTTLSKHIPKKTPAKILRLAPQSDDTKGITSHTGTDLERSSPVHKGKIGRTAALHHTKETNKSTVTSESRPRVINLMGPLTFHAIKENGRKISSGPVRQLKRTDIAEASRVRTVHQKQQSLAQHIDPPSEKSNTAKEAIQAKQGDNTLPVNGHLQKAKKNQLRTLSPAKTTARKTESPRKSTVFGKDSITRLLVNPTEKPLMRHGEIEKAQSRPVPVAISSDQLAQEITLRRISPLLVQHQNEKQGQSKISRNKGKTRNENRQMLQNKHDSKKSGSDLSEVNPFEGIDSVQDISVKELRAHLENMGQASTSEPFVSKDQDGHTPLAQLQVHQSSGGNSIAGNRTSKASSRPLAWLKAMLQRIEATEQAQGQWNTLEMNLDQGDGSLKIELKRHNSRVSVLVNFSESVLKTMAESQSAKIQQTLQNHFSHPVDLSFTSSHSDSTPANHDRQQRWRPDSQVVQDRSASESLIEKTSRRPATEAGNVWVG